MRRDLDHPLPSPEALETLRGYLGQTRNPVFLTGAGISTESGIPDFRSPGGLYSTSVSAAIFEISAFRSDPATFYRFWSEFLPQVEAAQPNPAHQAIARLQQQCPVTVVTQNIDDLHQRAGSRVVWPVHGTIIHSRCLDCGAEIETAQIAPTIRAGQVPRHSCGGIFKPEVTFFGEALPEEAWLNAQNAIGEADLLCLIGTSLTVYPAAALPTVRSRSCRLVIINQTPTPLDHEADLILTGQAGAILAEAYP